MVPLKVPPLNEVEFTEPERLPELCHLREKRSTKMRYLKRSKRVCHHHPQQAVPSAPQDLALRS